MECACIYVGDYDPPEVSVDLMRRARKPHKCGECGRTIERGEMYERAWSIYDGRHDTNITCVDCLSLRKAFFCEGWLYGSIWEQFWDWLQDAVYGDYFSWSKLGEVTPAARTVICVRIEEIWADEDLEGEER